MTDQTDCAPSCDIPQEGALFSVTDAGVLNGIIPGPLSRDVCSSFLGQEAKTGMFSELLPFRPWYLLHEKSPWESTIPTGIFPRLFQIVDGRSMPL